MYSTAFEALETADLDLLRTVLEDVRLDFGLPVFAALKNSKPC